MINLFISNFYLIALSQDIVLPDEYWEKGSQPFKYKWELIYEEVEMPIKENLKLEIEGTRVDLKKERRLDASYFRWT